MGRLFRFFLLLDTILLFALVLIKLQPSNASPNLSLQDSYLACLNNKEDKVKGLCLKKLATTVLQNNSTAQIEVAIQSISDSYKRQWCHEFLHYVGWELYEETNSIFDAFSKAGGECDSAMFHGIVEGYIAKAKTNADPEEFAKVIPKACEEKGFKKDISSGTKSLCYHGLGHGFMLVTFNDLNESLRYCDFAPGYAPSCYTGVFMENTQSKQVGITSNHPTKFGYDANNPNYPCDTLNEKYKDQCYVYKGISNVVETLGDFKQAFKDCLKVASQYQEKCFWGVGSNIPGPHWSTQTATGKCIAALEVSSKAYEQCIMGAMSFVIQLNLGNPQAAIEFCNVVDENYKDICYRASGISLGGWITHEESLEEKCKQFKEIKAQELCRDPDSNARVN